MPKGYNRDGSKATPPSRLGIKCSEKHRERIGNANKGKIRSDATKIKIGDASRGRKHTKTAKGKISQALKGKPKPWMKGNQYRLGSKHSKETIRKIRKLARKGKDNNRWKGGITPLTKQIRQSFKYRQWRSDIFTRDDFTCQDCWDKSGGNLNAHHIKPFTQIIEEYQIKTFEQAMNCDELWNINNGKTLCKKCHEKYK